MGLTSFCVDKKKDDSLLILSDMPRDILQSKSNGKFYVYDGHLAFLKVKLEN